MNERRRDYLPEDPVVTRSDNVSVLSVPKSVIDMFVEIYRSPKDRDYSESWSGSRVIRTTEIDRGLTEDIRMVEPLEKLAELNGAEIDYSNLIKQGCVLAHMRRNVQATLNYFRTYNQRDTRQRDTTHPQGL